MSGGMAKHKPKHRREHDAATPMCPMCDVRHMDVNVERRRCDQCSPDGQEHAAEHAAVWNCSEYNWDLCVDCAEKRLHVVLCPNCDLDMPCKDSGCCARCKSFRKKHYWSCNNCPYEVCFQCTAPAEPHAATESDSADEKRTVPLLSKAKTAAVSTPLPLLMHGVRVVTAASQVEQPPRQPTVPTPPASSPRKRKLVYDSEEDKSDESDKPPPSVEKGKAPAAEPPVSNEPPPRQPTPVPAKTVVAVKQEPAVVAVKREADAEDAEQPPPTWDGARMVKQESETLGYATAVPEDNVSDDNRPLQMPDAIRPEVKPCVKKLSKQQISRADNLAKDLVRIRKEALAVEKKAQQLALDVLKVLGQVERCPGAAAAYWEKVAQIEQAKLKKSAEDKKRRGKDPMQDAGAAGASGAAGGAGAAVAAVDAVAMD